MEKQIPPMRSIGMKESIYPMAGKPMQEKPNERNERLRTVQHRAAQRGFTAMCFYVMTLQNLAWLCWGDSQMMKWFAAIISRKNGL